MYLGKKLNLTPDGYNEYKALQMCVDLEDTFNGNLGKNNEDGAKLKAFLAGPRWAALMGNLERGIKVRLAKGCGGCVRLGVRVTQELANDGAIE